MLTRTLTYTFSRIYGFKKLLYDLQSGLVAMQNPMEILVATGKHNDERVLAQYGSSIHIM